MCGIDFLTRKSRLIGGLQPHQVDPAIQRRGPDSLVQLRETVGCWELTLTSSVLHLRGGQTVQQPLLSERYIFQWNGEVYSGLEIGCGDLMHLNDTELLFAALVRDQNIMHLFSRIQGEYAFTIVDRVEGRLYYGRDLFGRRSLVFYQDDERLHISSVIPAGSKGFLEVPAQGFWTLDLLLHTLQPQLVPWSSEGPLLKPLPPINRQPPLEPLSMETVISDTLMALERSLSRRLLCLPHIGDPKATVGILFSGGIDSALIAAIADRVLPLNVQIDLINVSFQNNRVARANGWSEFNYEAAPDRISGRTAFTHLQRLSPGRRWEFVTVNVPQEEYEAVRARVVSLMQPSNTVMDLSIAVALWFAASGNGCTGYKSQSRVLLLGMGADEQFGGYSRHRSAFETQGRAGVIDEMQIEVDRISSRNLGRDDRCISDHGKEARFPFLDEDFVAFVSQLPLEAKCDFALPRGLGEKRLLRLLCKHLGFSDQIAYLPKRAIQFGAKTAKMSSSTEVGTDHVCL